MANNESASTQDPPYEYSLPPTSHFENKQAKAGDKRLGSEEEVLAELKKDFEWFEAGDLGRTAIIGVYTDTNYTKSMEEISTNSRIRTLYNEKNAPIPESLNEYELLFVRARGYARFCELAQRLRFVKQSDEAVKTYSKVSAGEDLKKIDAKDRQLLVMETIADIELSLKNLLQPRIELETKLFGQPLDSPETYMVAQFASSNTVNESESTYGIYARTAIEILDNLVDEPNLNTDQSKYHGYIECIAEALSHELGHSGIENTDRLWWPNEEAWNHWKSVVLPRDLNGDMYKTYGTLRAGHIYMGKTFLQRAFDNDLANDRSIPPLYHHKVIKDKATGIMILQQNGGAETIAAMVEQISRELRHHKVMKGMSKLKVQNHEIPLDSDLALKSAIATSVYRIESGIMNINGEQIPAFRELFNAYTNELRKAASDSLTPEELEEYFPLYEQRMEGCSDIDYWNYTEYRKNQAKKNNHENLT